MAESGQSVHEPQTRKAESHHHAGEQRIERSEERHLSAKNVPLLIRKNGIVDQIPLSFHDAA